MRHEHKANGEDVYKASERSLLHVTDYLLAASSGLLMNFQYGLVVFHTAYACIIFSLSQQFRIGG